MAEKIEYCLIPKQPKEWTVDNLYFDIFLDGKWQGSRRLTKDELEMYKDRLESLNEKDWKLTISLSDT